MPKSMSTIKAGDTVALKYRKNRVDGCKFLGFTGMEEQYSETPKFDNLKAALSHYGASNVAELEKKGDDIGYGHGVYGVFSEKGDVFTVYLFQGKWCVGSSADKIVLEGELLDFQHFLGEAAKRTVDREAVEDVLAEWDIAKGDDYTWKGDDIMATKGGVGADMIKQALSDGDFAVAVRGFVSEGVQKDIPKRTSPVSVGGMLVDYSAYSEAEILRKLKDLGVTDVKQVYDAFGLMMTDKNTLTSLKEWVRQNPDRINAVFARLMRGGAAILRRGSSPLRESDESNVFDMPEGWWEKWKDLHQGEYDISKDEFSDVVDVARDGEVVFTYDKSRRKVFTSKPLEYLMESHGEVMKAIKKAGLAKAYSMKEDMDGYTVRFHSEEDAEKAKAALAKAGMKVKDAGKDGKDVLLRVSE